MVSGVTDRPILVTGAGGVVGRFLVSYLAARHIPVIAVLRREGPRADLPGVRWLCSPVEALPDLGGELDMVVHAAATSPGPGVSVDQMVRDNVEATRRLVAWARQCEVRRFVLLSAVSAYGSVQVPVVDEMTPSVDPDPYGLSKRIGEELLADSPVPSLCLRLPAVVGPGAKRNWMVRMKEAILAGRPVEVFNPEAPYNNLVHLDDLATLIERLRGHSFTGHDRVVLGASGQIPVVDAIRTLMDALGRKVELREMSSPRASFVIDSRRAREAYGYRPMEIGTMVRRFAADPC